jgi:hypothetical protein
VNKLIQYVRVLKLLNFEINPYSVGMKFGSPFSWHLELIIDAYGLIKGREKQQEWHVREQKENIYYKQRLSKTLKIMVTEDPSRIFIFYLSTFYKSEKHYNFLYIKKNIKPK